MAKRLQVLLRDPDYREIQRMARARHVSIAEWVRQALDAARRREPLENPGKRLDAIRAAVRYEFPSGEIEDILKEIEQGYRGGAQT